MKALSIHTQYAWTVSAILNNGKITWSKDTVRFTTTGTIVSVGDPLRQIPADYIVYQNYPNPFNPSTTLRFGVPKESKVTIVIYNMLGQKVAELADGIFAARYYEVVWNGSRYSSGIYFAVVRMVSTDASQQKVYNVKKLLMIK